MKNASVPKAMSLSFLSALVVGLFSPAFASAAEYETRTPFSFTLTGYGAKPAYVLANANKRMKEASVALSYDLKINENGNPLTITICKIQWVDFSADKANVDVSADLVCVGQNKRIVESIDTKNFIENGLSRELRLPLQVSPEFKPGSATVHNIR